MGLTVYIDNREQVEIKDSLREAVQGNCELVFDNLQLGDYILKDDADETEYAVIERKTLSDLAASIKDGRYLKQKAGLLGKYAPSKVIYIIEGLLDYSTNGTDNVLLNGVHYKGLITCVYNMMLLDKIHVVNTRDVASTVGFIRGLCDRILASPEKYKCELPSSSVKEDFIHITNKVVDPSTYFVSALCQVPGISKKTAQGITEQFKSMSQFQTAFAACSTHEIKTKIKETITTIDAKGKHRKLSERVVDNLVVCMFTDCI
jgi:ERCC4-type nuclease